MKVFKAEDSLIKKIKKIQLRTIEKFSSFIFEKKIQQIVEDIYVKRKLKALTGKEAVNICSYLQQ